MSPELCNETAWFLDAIVTGVVAGAKLGAVTQAAATRAGTVCVQWDGTELPAVWCMNTG